MSFCFHIRPVSLERGFELSCEGLIRDGVAHGRLLGAIVHAAKLGHDLPGEIRIFDTMGKVVEVLPLQDVEAGPERIDQGIALAD